jgi:hypothetical protein
MKLTSLFIATSALILISACGQDSAAIADVTEDAAEMFATAALIDPNTASADVIAAIPGVNAELAQQVISGRPYATPSALHAVLEDAVDENELRTIYSAMFVVVDLNKGSNADYRLIPSTLSPGHLAHEFEEYRPYSSIEQFGREMSKYVSAEEVAFLTRYVTID